MKTADYRALPIIALLTVSLSLSGCGGSGETPASDPASEGQQEQTENQQGEQAKADLDGPALAVKQFLQAAFAGDDEGARAMFTQVAREKASATAASLTPNRSDTATFEIGDVEYLGEDGARVGCSLTDMGNTTRMIWMVRKDPQDWRIAGTALEVFEGEPPVLLDFENPEEVQRKLGLIRQEMVRRARQQPEQEVAETPGSSPLR